MSGQVMARAGSGAIGLCVAYVAGLLAVTNLVFSAGVTASTRVPVTVVRTATYGLSLAATPAPPVPAQAAAPVLSTPPALVAPSHAASVAQQSDAATAAAAAPAQPAATTHHGSERRQPVESHQVRTG
ncbi:MAG TPA: hypothetical protein VF160_14765 [Candidatus Dormibacteraeota bacterium]